MFGCWATHPPKKNKDIIKSHKRSHLIHYFKQKQKQKSGKDKNLVKKEKLYPSAC
jgi:membrane-associated HD superfamily phosphohydrolase